MSVLIKGMKMPTSCANCRFEGCGYCFATGEQILHVGEQRDDVHPDCPLIKLPPHGRLIDADALRDKGWYLMRTNIYKGQIECAILTNPPTILEAEVGE